jgi:hypothetical protein
VHSCARIWRSIRSAVRNHARFLCAPECARAAREQSKADMEIASRFGALRERRRHSSATTRFIMLPNAVPLTGSTPMLGSLLEAHPQRFRLEFSRSRPLWILRGPPKTREIFGYGGVIFRDARLARDVPAGRADTGSSTARRARSHSWKAGAERAGLRRSRLSCPTAPSISLAHDS